MKACCLWDSLDSPLLNRPVSRREHAAFVAQDTQQTTAHLIVDCTVFTSGLIRLMKGVLLYCTCSVRSTYSMNARILYTAACASWCALLSARCRLATLQVRRRSLSTSSQVETRSELTFCCLQLGLLRRALLSRPPGKRERDTCRARTMII